MTEHTCERCTRTANVHVTEGPFPLIERHFCDEHSLLAIDEVAGRSTPPAASNAEIVKQLEDLIVHYQDREMDAERKDKILAALSKTLASFL